MLSKIYDSYPNTTTGDVFHQDFFSSVRVQDKPKPQFTMSKDVGISQSEFFTVMAMTMRVRQHGSLSLADIVRGLLHKSCQILTFAHSTNVAERIVPTSVCGLIASLYPHVRMIVSS